MSVLKIAGLAYGILLIAGGLIGAKAGSKTSLTMGILSGLLAVASSFLVDMNFALAAGLLLTVSGSLCAVFFVRLRKTGKFMPSGMLLCLSLLVWAVTLSQFFRK